jgi:hypothetical protein
VAGDFVERLSREQSSERCQELMKTASVVGKQQHEAQHNTQKSICTSREHKSSPRRTAQANEFIIHRNRILDGNFSSFIYLSSRSVSSRLIRRASPLLLLHFLSARAQRHNLIDFLCLCPTFVKSPIREHFSRYPAPHACRGSVGHELLLRCVSSPTRLLSRLSGDLHHGFRLD